MTQEESPHGPLEPGQADDESAVGSDTSASGEAGEAVENPWTRVDSTSADQAGQQHPYQAQPYQGQAQPYQGQAQPYQGQAQPYQQQPYQQQPYQQQPYQLQPYQQQPYQQQPYQQQPGAGYQQPPYPVPAGAPLSDSDARLWSVLSHVGMIVTGFIGPLIIWAVLKDRNPLVRQNAAAATNFGFLMAIAALVGTILSVVVVGAFILVAAGVVAIIFGIIGAVRANSGAVYPYPFNVKWIK